MKDHYSDGRRWSVISQGWILEECWTDKEEVAVLREKIAALETLNAELVEALEAALSDDQPYIEKCRAALAKVKEQT